MPGTRIAFGDGSPPWGTFVIAPPLGQELVISLAADRPLFDQPRPQIETAEQLLQSLETAMTGAENGALVVADIVAIDTADTALLEMFDIFTEDVPVE